MFLHEQKFCKPCTDSKRYVALKEESKPRREKPCFRGFANNTGADQPVHTRSLISAFVIHYLESIICKLATGEI